MAWAFEGFRVRLQVTYGQAVAPFSLVAAGAAIYLAFIDKEAAAITMGGLFLSMGIICQLDRFKSFEAFTVKAELQDRIERADELISQLRALSILVAKAGYRTTGMATIQFGASQVASDDLVEDFDDLLAKLKLSPSEMADAREPIVKAIAYRLWSTFIGVETNLYSLDGPLAGKFNPSEHNAAVALNYSRLLNMGDRDTLVAFMRAFLPDGLTTEQLKSADDYMDRLASIYDGCKKIGGATPEFHALEAKSHSSDYASKAARRLLDGKSID